MGNRGWALVACALGLSTAASAAPQRFWKDAREESLRIHHSFLGQVVKRAMPAVVSITTVDRPEEKAAPGQKQEPQKGVGSGFILSADGYILTCSHVIEDALEVHVTLLSPEGFPEEVPARVVGNDPQTDFALLKVDVSRKLPVLSLGSAASVDVADWLVVIGSPFGLAHSVSVGVVSYKGRTDVTPSGRSGAFEYIQTDASINPGNSGGPILDVNGDVVAIANAVNVAGQGIGFAVPVDMAKAVLPELRAHGQVRHGWMGISVQDLSPALARSVGLPSYAGVLVAEVSPGGPADQAGIRAGDVITELREAPVRRASDMRWRVETATVGDRLHLGVSREGRHLAMAVLLTEPPGAEAPAVPAVAAPTVVPPTVAAPTAADLGSRTLGAQVRQVDASASQKAGLARPFGALIVSVAPQSPLARAGVQPGDVVLKVNDTEVDTPRQFGEVLEDLDSGDLVHLFVRRGAQTLGLSFQNP